MRVGKVRAHERSGARVKAYVPKSLAASEFLVSHRYLLYASDLNPGALDVARMFISYLRAGSKVTVIDHAPPDLQRRAQRRGLMGAGASSERSSGKGGRGARQGMMASFSLGLGSGKLRHDGTVCSSFSRAMLTSSFSRGPALAAGCTPSTKERASTGAAQEAAKEERDGMPGPSEEAHEDIMFGTPASGAFMRVAAAGAAKAPAKRHVAPATGVSCSGKVSARVASQRSQRMTPMSQRDSRHTAQTRDYALSTDSQQPRVSGKGGAVLSRQGSHLGSVHATGQKGLRRKDVKADKEGTVRHGLHVVGETLSHVAQDLGHVIQDAADDVAHGHRPHIHSHEWYAEHTKGVDTWAPPPALLTPAARHATRTIQASVRAHFAERWHAATLDAGLMGEWRHREEHTHTHLVMILYLTKDIFIGPQGEALAAEVRAAIRARVRVLLVHPIEVCEFNRVIDTSPRDLVQAGLFQDIAVELRSGRYEEACARGQPTQISPRRGDSVGSAVLNARSAAHQVSAGLFAKALHGHAYPRKFKEREEAVPTRRLSQRALTGLQSMRDVAGAWPASGGGCM